MKKFVCVFLATILFFSVTGCSNNESANTSEKTETSEMKSLEQKETKETKREIGEKFTLGDWDVTLESFSFEDKISSGVMSSSAGEGNKFLKINFVVTNNGTDTQSFTQAIGGTNITAVYDEKYNYTPTITLLGGDLATVHVSPLADAEGFVTMKIPIKVIEAKESIVLKLETEDGIDKTVIDLR